MDVSKMLEELRAERDQINEAILALERIALGSGKRRGRPPAWISEARKQPVAGEEEGAVVAPVKRGKKRRVLSEESRKKMAEAQKRRWASHAAANAAETA